MKQSFFRIIFLITFNILLFCSISKDLRFLYLTLNLLIIFFMFEFYINKRKIKKKIEEIKKTNVENNFDINYIPASEHPIIKAAKERLKN